MIISPTNAAITTRLTEIQKTKYFSIELTFVGMMPNTQYDLYVDGVKMNNFVKPFGKNLGDPIMAGLTGKLNVQYHMSIPFQTRYLVDQGGEAGYISQSKKIELRDPNGHSSATYLPVRLKAIS